MASHSPQVTGPHTQGQPGELIPGHLGDVDAPFSPLTMEMPSGTGVLLQLFTWRGSST